MGLFDSVMNSLKQGASKVINEAADSAAAGVKKAVESKKETFTFNDIPTTVEELQAIPEYSMDTPYKTAALAILVLCNYENNPENTYAMLDALRGPDPMTVVAKNFIKDRLEGKTYKPYSFFEGATVENNYTPNLPLKITVSSNAYSFPEENWATIHAKSAGADSDRPIKLRLKPSTNQWFLNDIQILADIRVPVAENPWA